MKFGANYRLLISTTLMSMGVTPIAFAESTCLPKEAKAFNSHTTLPTAENKPTIHCHLKQQTLTDDSAIASTVILNSDTPEYSTFSHLQTIEQPFTQAKYLFPQFSFYSPQSFQITQAEAAVVQITGVGLNPIPGGVDVI
jgi:hypothetical protein